MMKLAMLLLCCVVLSGCSMSLQGDNGLTVAGNSTSNVVTLALDGTVVRGVQTDSGNATGSGHWLAIVGAGNTTTSASGNTVTISSESGSGSAGLSSAVLSFTRNLASGTGDVSYTGVGFKPTSLIAFAQSEDVTHMSGSWGVCGSTGAEYCTYGHETRFVGYDSSLIRIYDYNATSTMFQTAVLKTYDDDGFTLSWTRSNVPTGTAYVVVVCYK